MGLLRLFKSSPNPNPSSSSPQQPPAPLPFPTHPHAASTTSFHHHPGSSPPLPPVPSPAGSPRRPKSSNKTRKDREHEVPSIPYSSFQSPVLGQPGTRPPTSPRGSSRNQATDGFAYGQQSPSSSQGGPPAHGHGLGIDLELDAQERERLRWLKIEEERARFNLPAPPALSPLSLPLPLPLPSTHPGGPTPPSLSLHPPPRTTLLSPPTHNPSTPPTPRSPASHISAPNHDDAASARSVGTGSFVKLSPGPAPADSIGWPASSSSSRSGEPSAAPEKPVKRGLFNLRGRSSRVDLSLTPGDTDPLDPPPSRAGFLSRSTASSPSADRERDGHRKKASEGSITGLGLSGTGAESPGAVAGAGGGERGGGFPWARGRSKSPAVMMGMGLVDAMSSTRSFSSPNLLEKEDGRDRELGREKDVATNSAATTSNSIFSVISRPGRPGHRNSSSVSSVGGVAGAGAAGGGGEDGSFQLRSFRHVSGSGGEAGAEVSYPNGVGGTGVGSAAAPSTVAPLALRRPVLSRPGSVVDDADGARRISVSAFQKGSRRPSAGEKEREELMMEDDGDRLGEKRDGGAAKRLGLGHVRMGSEGSMETLISPAKPKPSPFPRSFSTSSVSPRAEDEPPSPPPTVGPRERNTGFVVASRRKVSSGGLTGAGWAGRRSLGDIQSADSSPQKGEGEEGEKDGGDGAAGLVQSPVEVEREAFKWGERQREIQQDVISTPRARTVSSVDRNAQTATWYGTDSPSSVPTRPKASLGASQRSHSSLGFESERSPKELVSSSPPPEWGRRESGTSVRTVDALDGARSTLAERLANIASATLAAVLPDDAMDPMIPPVRPRAGSPVTISGMRASPAQKPTPVGMRSVSSLSQSKPGKAKSAWDLSSSEDESDDDLPTAKIPMPDSRIRGDSMPSGLRRPPPPSVAFGKRSESSSAISRIQPDHARPITRSIPSSPITRSIPSSPIKSAMKPLRPPQPESSTSEDDSDEEESSEDEPLTAIARRGSALSLQQQAAQQQAVKSTSALSNASPRNVASPTPSSYTITAGPGPSNLRNPPARSNLSPNSSPLSTPPISVVNSPALTARPVNFGAFPSRDSPASSQTGDTSSGTAPLTPREGSIGSDLSVAQRPMSTDAGRVLADRGGKGRRVSFFGPDQGDEDEDAVKERKRRDRRREEAKAAIELGHAKNGPDYAPLNDTQPSSQHDIYNPYQERAQLGQIPAPQMIMPPMMDPQQMFAMQMQMQQMAQMNPAYMQMHQQAMMVAKQQYQAAVAAAAMQAADEAWERSSNMTGFTNSGPSMNMQSMPPMPPLPMFGMPMMPQFVMPGSQSSYGGGGSQYGGSQAGWGSASVYGESFGPPAFPRSTSTPKLSLPKENHAPAPQRNSVAPSRRRERTASASILQTKTSTQPSSERGTSKDRVASQSKLAVAIKRPEATTLQTGGGLPPSSWRGGNSSGSG